VIAGAKPGGLTRSASHVDDRHQPSSKRIAKTAASPFVASSQGPCRKPIGDRTPTRCLVGGLAVGVFL